MESITLQTSDSSVVVNDILGRLGFAASSESDGGDSVLVAAMIKAVAEENFGANANRTSIVFSTANSATADDRLKITSDGHFVPVSGQSCNVGSSTYPFANVYSNAFIKSGGTSSQYLMADGSVSTPSFVGGTGTSGYIPKWNSSSTLNNSPIFANSFYVGIGTSSPLRLLQVEGGNVGFNRNNGSYIFHVGSTATDNLLYVDGTSNDKVGINTTSPSYKLDVNGTFSANSINVNDQYTFPTGVGSVGDSLVYTGSNQVAWSGVTLSGNLAGDLNLNNYDIVGTGNITIDGNITAEYFYGDLDGVVITECRNGTAGTISEGTPVYVSGYYSSNGKPLIAEANASSSSTMPAIGLLASDLASGAEGHVHVFGLAQNLPSGVTNGFSVGETVYVAAGGGLTNVRPTGVSELVQNMGRVLKTGTNGRILVLGPGRSNDVPNSGHFEQLTVDGQTILAKDGGNVGIGTASPQAKLDVNGTVEFDDLIRWEYPDKALDTSTSTLGYMRLYDEASGYAGLGVSTSNFNIGTSGLINLRFVVNAEDRLVLSTNGCNTLYYNSGCGLDLVKSTDSTDGLHFGDKAYSTSSAYQGIKHLLMTGSQDYMMISEGTNTLVSAKNGGSVYIRGGGNYSRHQILVYGNSTGGVVVNENGLDSDFRVEGDSDTHLLFTDASTDRVGIGTAAPLGKLHIESTILHSANATNRGQYIDVDGSITSSATSFILGTAIDARKNIANGVTDTGYIMGGDFVGVAEGGGSINESYGVRTYAGMHTAGSGTITNAFGVRSRVLNLGTGTITNGYGLYIDDVAATSAYGIYQIGSNDDNYFAGSVGIGTATPTRQLHTDGTTALIADGSTYELDISASAATLGGNRFQLLGTETVFNNAGGNVDFRVEGDADTHLLFTDASSDRVGIGVDVPSQKLDVDGSIRTISGGVGHHENGCYIAYPGGGSLRNTNPTQTGYLKITLPVSWTNTMISFDIDVYEYATQKIKKFRVGGYTYSVSTQWINESAMMDSDNDFAKYKVHFGHDGTNCAIYISEIDSSNTDLGSSTTWSYAQVSISNIYVGYSATTMNSWASGWNIEFTTTLGTTTGSIEVSRPYRQHDNGYVFNEYGGNVDFRVEGDSDENLLFTDASTDRVGIQTSAPTVNFEIGRNTSTPRALSVRHSTVPAYISNGYDGTYSRAVFSTNIYNTSSGTFAWSSPFANSNFSAAAIDLTTNPFGGGSQIRFYTATVNNTEPTERMHIDGDGNVGIGTASPSYNLDVNGTFSANSVNVNDQFTFPTTDGSADQVLVTNGSGVITWQNQSAGSASVTAWGSYNGSTNARGQEYNVSSITDNGSVGNHTINLSITMSSTDYCVVANEYHRTSWSFGTSTSVTYRGTTSFTLWTGAIQGTTPSAYDSVYVAYAVFGS